MTVVSVMSLVLGEVNVDK